MDPLGIADGAAGTGSRDPAGHVQGFYGVQHARRRLRPARRADAPRRRLARAAAAVADVHARRDRAVGDQRLLRLADLGERGRAVRRPDDRRARRSRPARDFPDLPADMYSFSGLFGQRVTVFPSQDIVIVRTGPGPRPACPPAGAELGARAVPRVLGVDDRPADRAGPATRRAARRPSRTTTTASRPRSASPTSTARAPTRTRCRPPARARPRRAALARAHARRAGAGAWCAAWLPAALAGPQGGAGAWASPRPDAAPSGGSATAWPPEVEAAALPPDQEAPQGAPRARIKTYRFMAVNSDLGGGTESRTSVRVRRPLRPSGASPAAIVGSVACPRTPPSARPAGRG